jgi:nucleoside-diphosphate-sugar epimerase
MTRGEVETMRVLITGAGGTLGTALAPLLAEAGHEPVLLDIQPPPASQHLVAFAATILILPQEAPAQQTLDGPPPFDETVDTTALGLCLT